MFAIDSVKGPNNASKHRSGTRAEFTQRAEKLEAAAQTMLDRHRATDVLETEPDVAAKAITRIVRLQEDAQQLRDWRATHWTDRHGPTGGLRQSNRTDNGSAKMATEKGVIQGYTGVAAVDAKHQIIVDAQAHGMQQRLDAPEGRDQYGRCLATVAPVFANVRYNKRLDRFTLRGRTKVNGQWLPCCLVHNIEKLTHARYAA